MKIGYLFPGQGAQSLGMGKDIYEKYDVAKDVYKKVQELTGIDVAKITFENEELLNQTQYTQICILTMSLAILEILKQNEIQAEISSGLSLGEYTALINSGVLSFEDGIRLVKKRGEYMQKLVPEGEWLMAAVLGMEEEKVIEVCKLANEKSTENFVVPVNFNCPGQIVISGNKAGVETAEIIAKEQGARKVRELKTSGPFHTEKLKEASEALKKDLEKVEFHQFNNTVIKNIDGTKYKETDDIRDILAKHIISPVKFTAVLQKMLDLGVDTFVEVGPGKTLSGFIKKMPTEKEIKILNICNCETLENVLKEVK